MKSSLMLRNTRYLRLAILAICFPLIIATALATPPTITAQPQFISFFTLYSFTGGNDGGNPFAGLIQGTDGRLYGTTQDAGAYGQGTVFAVNSDGAGFTTLYSFTGGNDGSSPAASLIQGIDGRLYGATLSGNGTVFAVNSDGAGFTTLHSFTGGNDGAGLFAGLIQGTDGRLYGTAAYGGAISYGSAAGNGFGTVFVMNTDGTGFATLHSFTGGSDGASPYGSLVQGTDGRLYGTTGSFGAGGVNGEQGTVFAINPDGTDFTTLYSLTGGNGQGPFGLIQGTDGRLYGTTGNGGAYGYGTVFAINKDGVGFAVLCSFTGGNDGDSPQASLIQGPNGRLYGTTVYGGASGTGTVFAINPDGADFTMLYSFMGGNDGNYPQDSLLQGTDGRLYGTTLYGGTSGMGTVFAISDQSVIAGSNPTATVIATGTDPLSYQWQFDGTNIAGATSATLTLTNVSAANDGNYTVIVSNSEGSVTSNLATLSVLAPAINSLNPSTATAGSGAFTLTVTGANFANGSTVNWNGSARPTTFVSSTVLTAAIPASDIAVTNDLATALVTVQSPSGDLSNALALPIVNPNVAAVQSTAAAAGGTATVTTAPSTSGTVGVTAILQDNGTVPAAVTVADYTANPTGVLYFDVGGGFVDIQVTGATAADTATAYFYYPSTVTGTNETNLTLLYFDGSAWQSVLSSGGATPAKDTTDNLDGTVSGGKFTVTFDNTSTPSITNLVGTVFTITVKTIPPALVNQGIALNGNAKVTGSIQVLTGTPSSLNGNAAITGNLFVAGSPSVVLNGHPTYGGTLVGAGSSAPLNYQVTLNGNASLLHAVTHTAPATFPTVAAPPAPTGTKDITITSPGNIPTSFVGIRNLTLSSGAGAVAIPAGTYGNLSVNGTASLILGVAGSTQAAVYNLQQLSINGTGQVTVIGPVVLVVANGASFIGNAGSSAHPDWLTIELASGGLAFNGKANCYAEVVAPSSPVTINGNSTLTGSIACQNLSMNGNSALSLLAPGQ